MASTVTDPTPSTKAVSLPWAFQGRTFTARSVSVTSAVGTSSAGGTSFRVEIADVLSAPLPFNNSDDCGHTAVNIRVSSDEIKGVVSLTVAPQDAAQAYLVDLSGATGRFKIPTLTARGTLHGAYSLDQNGTILWAKPGEPIVLDYSIDDSFGQPPASSVLEFTVRGLGTAPSNMSELASAIKRLPRRQTPSPVTNQDTAHLVDVFLSSVRDQAATDALIKSGTFRELYESLQELFQFEVWPNPGTTPLTRDLKVSARLMGFKLGARLLTELNGYCDKVSVQLPGETLPVPSTKARLSSLAISTAVKDLRLYPIDDLVKVTHGSDSDGSSYKALANYFEQHDDGLAPSLEVLEYSAKTLPPGLIGREFKAAVSQYRLLVALEAETLNSYRGHLFPELSHHSSSQLAPAKRLKDTLSTTLQSLLDLQAILDLESPGGTGFFGHMFVTDAHMVQLVQGNVDPYLAAVAPAYVMDPEVSRQLAEARTCMTGP